MRSTPARPHDRRGGAKHGQGTGGGRLRLRPRPGSEPVRRSRAGAAAGSGCASALPGWLNGVSGSATSVEAQAQIRNCPVTTIRQGLTTPSTRGAVV